MPNLDPNNLVLFHNGGLSGLLSAKLAPWVRKAGTIIVQASGDTDDHALIEAIKDKGPLILITDPEDSEAINPFDGAYISSINNLNQEPSSRQSRQNIIGIGGITDRHSGLEAGEYDPDFVLFGLQSANRNSVTLDQKLAFLAWWQEIVIIPLVSFAQSVPESETLLAHGAQWVALNTETLS